MSSFKNDMKSKMTDILPAAMAGFFAAPESWARNHDIEVLFIGHIICA